MLFANRKPCFSWPDDANGVAFAMVFFTFAICSRFLFWLRIHQSVRAKVVNMKWDDTHSFSKRTCFLTIENRVPRAETVLTVYCLLWVSLLWWFCHVPFFGVACTNRCQQHKMGRNSLISYDKRSFCIRKMCFSRRGGSNGVFFVLYFFTFEFLHIFSLSV